MSQATAVVLDSNQNKRDEIRIFLSQCGVLPICFADEWICVENIFHIKPTFAVLRTSSAEMAIHFIYVARAIERMLPIIIVSDQPDVQRIIGKPWLNDIFWISFPAMEKELKKQIETIGVSASNPLQAGQIGELPVTKQNLNQLQRIGLSNEPVLIQGEPGVGKRLIAKTICHCGATQNKSWHTVSAQDISGPWVRRLHRQIDYLPQPGSPLISCVIENVEALSDRMQSQLVPIMDTLTAKRNGDGSTLPLRFIFLADADLSYLNRSGRFRTDLYHRLTVLKINVPPLRARREDISLLADFFTAKYSIEKLGYLVRLDNDIQAAFRAYDWPGNVTQLEGIIRRAMATGPDSWADQLGQWCRGAIDRQHGRFTTTVFDIDDCLQKIMDGNQAMSLKTARQHCVMQVEKNILKTALSRTHGNCKKAASLLNISYKSMLNKVKEYRLVGG